MMGSIHWLTWKNVGTLKRNVGLNKKQNWVCHLLTRQTQGASKQLMLKSETIYVLDALDYKEMFFDANLLGLYMIFFLYNLLTL